ncbi:hypothetical protein EDC65_4367 [Stella humosa]|uniref:Sulfotransferase family protein n=1 Tax=Stella humosa TaxID=94 RepID=A0A3N1KZG9_9PROT|nr:hypothetical protein [Stella humosa]ROP83718.1 hypothetical protein EDC65_4367 [Stella humosa]BBK33010.1 hypothetical protein STHU_36440 [Stella humosa]
MTVYLHVGPHKTGTTAVQRAMSRNAGLVYPAVKRLGPGHALLAWQSIGSPQRPAEPDLLLDVVRAQLRADAPLVLSSEEFSTSIMPGRSAEALVRLADTFPVELIVTLTPAVERAVSMAQEVVKHGQPVDFHDEAAMRAIVRDRPGLQPDLPERLMGLANWRAVHFVLADRSRRDRLFEIFSAILGVPIRHDPDDRMYLNSRYCYAEMAILSALNRISPGSGLVELRTAARQALLAARASLPDIAAVDYPPLPHPLARELDQLWGDQLQRMEAWDAAGTARLHR